jgi:simple sugar transport system permease protein
MPSALQIPLLFVVGAAAGMILLLVPLWLRLRFSVDEVVTTLLLNFVAILFVSMLIDGVLKDPTAFGWPQSVGIDSAAKLPKLLARSRLHIGLIIAIGLAFAIHFVQSRTVFGLQSRAAGLNPTGAVFAGVPLARTLVIVAMMSGGLAGFAGAIEVMGVKGYVTTDLSPGYGYSGIVVAMLANLNPLGVVLAALFTAIMFVGADGMSRSLGIPTYIADVTVALSLISMLIAVFFTQYRIRR